MTVLSAIFILIAFMSIIGMFILLDENNCATPAYIVIAAIAICCSIYIEFHLKETIAQKSINERFNQLTVEKEIRRT